MIQLYPLSIMFLIFVSLMNFLEVWKTELSILLRLKHRLIQKERERKILFYTALLLGCLELFFPMFPGPMFLGDLMPALALFWSSLYFVKLGKGDEMNSIESGRSFKDPYFRKGALLALASLVHLLFPHFVIL